MNIKTKKIKNPRQFPYQNYKAKIDNHKFEANLFDDDGGEFTAELGNKHSICRSDATLKDWIDEYMEICDFYHNLIDFLEEVEYSRRK